MCSPARDTAALIASLATPAEWAGLTPAEQARYLATLNPQGVGLLAGVLAPAEGCPPRQLLAQWARAGLVTAEDLFAAGRHAGSLS